MGFSSRRRRPTGCQGPEGERQAEKLVTVATPFRMVGPTRVPRNPDDATIRAVVTEVAVGQNASELSAIAGKVGIGPDSLAAIKVGTWDAEPGACADAGADLRAQAAADAER